VAFDWQTYVVIARELFECEKEACNEQAYLRTAISRAYYGIHNISYRFLTLKKGIAIDGKRKHKQTFMSLKASHIAAEKELGERLKTLYDGRLLADYDDGPPVSITDTKLSIFTAEEALKNLKTVGAVKP